MKNVDIKIETIKIAVRVVAYGSAIWTYRILLRIETIFLVDVEIELGTRRIPSLVLLGRNILVIYSIVIISKVIWDSAPINGIHLGVVNQIDFLIRNLIN